MRILSLVDKKGTAIDRLQEAIAQGNPHLEFRVLAVHPKRPDHHEIAEAVKAVKWADIIHVGYWRSFEKLKEYVAIPKDKITILSHHNPYDLVIDKDYCQTMGFGKNMQFTISGQVAWNDMYDAVVVSNASMHEKLPYTYLIPQGIDLNFWQFNEHYDKDGKTILMVSSRIEGKKGVKEVAQVCHELGYKFLLVGRISKGDYFEEVKQVCPNIEFRENVTEKELQQAYHDATILVVNSVDDFESGPTPVLEAMASGVPVISRNVGHVPDLYDGQNILIRYGTPDDVDDLKHQLRSLQENLLLRDKMRSKGWETVKNRGADRMAARFEQLYYRLLAQKYQLPMVSVITPSYNRLECILESVTATILSDYPALELVIVDSSTPSLVQPIREYIETLFTKLPDKRRPVKYIHFDATGYTLPEARNRGILASSGVLLVFCDERIAMKQGAVTEFVKRWNPGQWLWGVKDEYEKGFVENFSCIARSDIIRYGGFNTLIDGYGGATQELRSRFEVMNNLQFSFISKAKAHSIKRSRGKDSRRKDIIKSKFKVWKLYGDAN